MLSSLQYCKYCYFTGISTNVIEPSHSLLLELLLRDSVVAIANCCIF